MALVRISQALINDVNEVICQMERDELNQTAGDAAPASAVEMYDACMEAAWMEAPQLKAVIPASWKRTFDSVDFHACNGEGRTYFFYQSVNMKEANKGKFELPHNFGSDYRPDIYVPESIWSKYPTIANRAAYVRKQQELKGGIEAKYTGVKTKIKSFLRGCKSLNDAVKKWEGVKLYIPKRYLSELERVVVRNARAKGAEEADVPVDVEELVAIGAMHRIMGGAS